MSSDRSSTETRDPAGRCPFDPASFDPRAPGMVSNPFPKLEEARNADQSTFFMPDYDMWCMTEYDDVVDGLSNYRIYSSAKMVRVWPPPPETADDLPEGHPLEGALVSTDPPRHTRIRKLSQKAFTPKLVAEREPAIRAIVDRYVEALLAAGSPAELVSNYCAKIPPAVVAQILGVPQEDAGTFRAWALEAHELGFSPPTMEEEEILRLSRNMVNFDGYIRALIEARRNHPEDDLTSHLVHAKDDEGDQSLTDKELVSLISSFVTAGSDTTSSLIGHAVYLILNDPDLYAEVDADRSLVGNLVEETLRVLPSARAMSRTTICPAHVGGSEVPAGETMYVNIASANRDPEVFAEPDKVDLHRPNLKRHMSFGTRTHRCLGAPLAQLEAKLAIEGLMDGILTMRLAPGEALDDAHYDGNMYIPSLTSLRLEWEA